MGKEICFEEAKQKHSAWKQHVRDFLDDKIKFEAEQITTHTCCDLGKWYYSEGKEKYGHLTSMQNMEVKHTKLHKIIKDVYDFKLMGDEDMVEDLYFDILDTADKVVFFLTEAENEINN
jgi:hypothetical protein